MEFRKWNGPDGMNNHIIQETGSIPYSGAGICPRPDKKNVILKSVDNTSYYDDNLSDPNNVEYTIFGHNGDQDEAEPHFNEPLLNKDKIENIYLYRVRKEGKKTIYTWYGKYAIKGKVTRRHPGKDGVERNIVVLLMVRV